MYKSTDPDNDYKHPSRYVDIMLPHSSKYIGDLGFAIYKNIDKNPIELDLNLNSCNFDSFVAGRLSLDHCKKANKYINDIDKFLENVCKGKKDYTLIEDEPIKDIIDKLE